MKDVHPQPMRGPMFMGDSEDGDYGSDDGGEEDEDSMGGEGYSDDDQAYAGYPLDAFKN